MPDRLRILDLTDELAFHGARLLVGLGADVVRVERSPAPALSRAETLHWHAGKRIVGVPESPAALDRLVEQADVVIESGSLDQLLGVRAEADAASSTKDGAGDRAGNSGGGGGGSGAGDSTASSTKDGAGNSAGNSARNSGGGGAGDGAASSVEGGAVSSRWPGVVHVVVTPFGTTGPRRAWRADDLVAAAAGGMAWLGGQPGQPPKPPPREQATQLAGAHAAIAALLGVIARDRTGRGQLIDISVQEAVAATLETAAISWIHAGRYPSRNGGVYEHVAHRVFRAADGHVAGGYSGSDRMWTDLLAWMAESGEAEDLTEEKWSDPVFRWRGRAHVDEIVARFAAKRSAAFIAAEGRARALPWAEVATADRLPANPQLTERAFFTRILGEGLPRDGVMDVGFPFAAPDLPRPVRLNEPLPADAEAPWQTSRPRGRQEGISDGSGGRSLAGIREGASDRAGGRSLAGIRVLDLTWVLAGPYATKTLAEHGADIIKIESRHRQDPTRFAPSMRLRPEAGFDDSGYFINFNRGKRGVALNLRTEPGREALRRLVAECDVVIENFSPGVLDRWGLSYDRMAELNPGVILVSMAGVGQSGPWRDAVTFADTLAAMSGLTSETADPGEEPQGLTFGLGDMVAANSAVLAVLDMIAAGRGGHVDLSQLESMAASMGPAVLEAELGDRRTDSRTAAQPNRHPRMVPHGVYPTRGDDRWIALAVQGDAEWRRLTEHAGLREPTSAGLPVSASAGLEESVSAGLPESASAGLPVSASAGLEERRRHEDAIDAALAAWCAERDGESLAAELQGLGIAAAVVATGRDLVDADEHLAARDFYPVLEHPIAGPVRHEGIVVRMSATPGALTAPAPLLGEHTDAVLKGLLGMDDDELSRLREAGVLE
ncbi:CaiB/BaiF CoA-transferase family protein [Nonomuraea guangzhouensis]|uniref:CoA transferase n=1 Tax=Nonomuraea guangzhouensis TaxID=1291555 RepID=A0ABW4GD74_9ACTN|nr:CoA transferase [Nonomuraea guangzhouensis]